MSAAARPLVSVQASGEQLRTPAVLTAPIRPDIVHFVHTSMNKNKRQAYSVNVDAGHQHSAHSWGTGRAVARIPRVSGGGTSRCGQAAFGNMVRKGRMFAPTKTWRKWHRKINTNQKRFAVASALAASALPSLVLARGHRIAQVPEIPLVIGNAAESFVKTKEAVEALQAIGAYADVEKAKASRKVRRGLGKLRGRRHVQRRGPLVVYANDNGIVKAFRNLPGVELAHVDRLNLLQLAPGGHLGRFIVWTADAFKRLDEVWGSTRRESATKKGYKLPQPQMANSDITRLINSDEVQSKVRPANRVIVRAQRKKNPLRNLGVRVRLNPYALSLRRSELLAQERRAAQKAAQVDVKRSAAALKKAAAGKLHKATAAENFKKISTDDYVRGEIAKKDFSAAIKAAGEKGWKGQGPKVDVVPQKKVLVADVAPLKRSPEAEAAAKKQAARLEEFAKAGIAVVTKSGGEGFNLEKCLAYTQRELPEDVAEEFVDELRAKWNFVDVDASGLITYDELRAAVWHNDGRDLKELPSSGKLEPELQDVIDDIISGCGNKQAFNYWDFAKHMLDEFDHEIAFPAIPSNPWAVCPDE